MGNTFFTGCAISDTNIQIIVQTINRAFEEGKETKIFEIKKALNIKE